MWLSFLCGSFSPQPDGVAHAVVSALPYILETEHIYVWGNGSDLSDTSLHVLTVSSTVGFTVKKIKQKTVVLPGYYN